jgi:AhpD family alkylhydroperoxidase
MGHAHDVIDELRGPTRSLRQAAPAAWEGFTKLHGAAVADGVLSGRVKELMALAIAVVKACDGCIAYHAQAAVRKGATPEEVAEALSVALLMDGGTATVYGPRAWAAFEEFAAPVASAAQRSEVDSQT